MKNIFYFFYCTTLNQAAKLYTKGIDVVFKHKGLTSMRMKIIIAIVLIVGGFGFLIISSSSEESHPHYQLPEFFQKISNNRNALEGKFMTVYGNVKEGSIKKDGIKADFTIIDGDKELNVFFTGKTLLPDTFKAGAQASVDGIYDAPKNRFVADKVMAKCASKYNSAGKYKNNTEL